MSFKTEIANIFVRQWFEEI